jgi:glycosyltransferase involved in cell wall biosynthesis
MKLSIIIANRNDIVVLNLTINNAIEMLKSIDGDGEVVICDNSDAKIREILPIAYPPSYLKSGLLRVINQDQPSFTAARMAAAKAAKGEYLFCVDSHVLFGYNTLRDSIDFMERHKGEPIGFGHPPIRWAHQGIAAKRHSLKMNPNGTPQGGWGYAVRGENKIFWKFMPWICRRDWYLDVLDGYGSHAKHFISWGGAELLQQIKSWMLGYEQWAVDTDPIIHIGPYNPAVIKTGQYKYRTYSANGRKPHGFGVLLAYYVLGGDDAGYKHAKLNEEGFNKRHKIKVDDYWGQARAFGKEEREWLIANKKYDYLELLEKKPWEN